MLHMPAIKTKREFLIENGIKKPLDFFNLRRDDVPWITQTMPGASLPVEFVPKNVSSVGPITVSVAPIAEQDEELSIWLKQKPTVFINLGSSVKYNEERATIMVGAIKEVLDQQSDIQVLWFVFRLSRRKHIKRLTVINSGNWPELEITRTTLLCRSETTSLMDG